MSFKDATNYPKDHEFTQEQLLTVAPEDVVRWFNLKAYGTVTPVGVDPTECRSSSLMYWKKALSSFMPNRLASWNVESKTGNPTKSVPVNDMIKIVKRAEVRQKGKESQARRALTPQEFARMLNILCDNNENDLFRKYLVPSLTKFQFHMIGRIDDCCQFFANNLTAPSGTAAGAGFTLRARLAWSKNVGEERAAPNQILMGAMDPTYCVLIGLAVWLEVFMTRGGVALQTPYIFGLNDNITVPAGGDRVKDQIQAIFANEIFNRAEFQTGGLLGSHSVRKYASSHARGSGANKDDKDLRGRWKVSTRISDVYDNVELPFVDAEVAGMLCVGGPVRYDIKEESGLTNAFVLQHVVPGIRGRFGDGVASVLGPPLLWLTYSDGGEYIPQDIRQRIQNNCNLPDGFDGNPVKKSLLVITGRDAIVHFDTISDTADIGNVGGDVPPDVRHHLIAISSQIAGVRQAIDRQIGTDEDFRTWARREITTLRQVVRRLARQPAFPVAVGGDNNNENNNNNNGGRGQVAVGGIGVATLTRAPRTLYELWDEYMSGMGGRKPARLFTREERGRVKYKYCRRKIVWDCVATLVNAGLTSDVACDRIYAVYGVNTTVTQIINQMKNDKNQGIVHPSLHP